MSRLTLEMTGQDMIMAVGGGNPGGLTVLINSIKLGPIVDPDSALGPFTFLMLCDTYGIYESEIWLLFKDVARENYAHAHGLLRAMQMGIVSPTVVKTAMQNYGRGINVQEILDKLVEKLPSFNLNPHLSEPAHLDQAAEG